MKLDSNSLLNSSSLLLYAVTDRSWLGEETEAGWERRLCTVRWKRR